MDNCFVIQPFDNDKFDKRFKDVYQPAINNAGLKAYRVDEDLAVRVPIDDIEKGISESSFCFADITIDNPNVWYELGYAFACKKDVIMVCSDERHSFPFDIQHRLVIKYKTGSSSDFKILEEKITNKIKALQVTSKTVKQLHNSPVVEKEGLKSHEIALLILMMETQITLEDITSAYTLKNEMTKAGYTDIATSLAIRNLSKLRMIIISKEYDDYNNGGEYVACRLTEKGENWILSNQDQLQFRIVENMDIKSYNSGDELPF